MGGAGYIFTGDNDANVMHNSALINLNVVNYATKFNVKNICSILRFIERTPASLV